VADITYIPTREGWQSAVLVLDLFGKRIFGWALDAQMVQEPTL
jgi:putative transposase